jgi:hypothetical protein
MAIINDIMVDPNHQSEVGTSLERSHAKGADGKRMKPSSVRLQIEVGRSRAIYYAGLTSLKLMNSWCGCEKDGIAFNHRFSLATVSDA